MKRPAIAAAIVALGIVAFLFFRSRDEKEAPTSDTPTADAPKERAPRQRGDRQEMPAELSVLMDDDLEGTLRLEGQVIDADQTPVAGAVVHLDSNPPRTTTSEEDGSFYFDKLVARRYELVARADEGTAGPVEARLSDNNDPVILIIRPAATVEVKVIAATDRRPVSGAEVEVRGNLTEGAIADSDGVARVPRVPAGFYQVVARAPGYAQSANWMRVGGGDVTEQIELQLRRGAPVAGRVVDPAGAPVQGAVVLYSGASDWSQQANERFDGALTDAKGEFRIDALPAGTFRFRARHKQYAPGVSEAVTLDGSSERTGVVISLEAGAVLAGRVLDKQGEPVPAAAVRVVQGGRGMRFERARQTFTDEQGGFEMKALPRRELNIIATHETATSEIQDINMEALAEKRDVELVLDVDGRIAGIVVDSQGDPVEGAQVIARPNFRRGANFRRRDWRLRGMGSELSDAGGRFEFRGLQDIDYVLMANPPGVSGRGRAWMREGTDANVGDLDVRIVLEKDGGITGKVAFEDGTVPEAFTVSVGGGFRGRGGTPFSTKTGEFELEDLPARTYTVTIRGVGFEQKQVADVEVASGQVKDLGTITVTKGRTLAGKVITADRRPVAGATVTVGKMLFGSGSSTSTGGRFGPPGAQRNKEVVTDDNGEFTVRGVGAYDLNMVAEHETEGRTQPVSIPGSRESTFGIELVMAPTGALEGIVTVGGKPADGIRISCQSQQVPGAIFGVATGDDGKFRFDRLAPGHYMVSAMTGGNPMRGMGFHDGKSVAVVSNQTAQVALEIGQGNVELLVNLVAKDGGEPGFSQIFSAQTEVTAKTAKELSLQMANRDGGYSSFGISIAGRPALIRELSPGAYTVCAAPYPSGIQGMQMTMDYMEQHGDEMPIYCKPVTVAEQPERQEVTIEVVIPEMIPPDDGA